MKKTRKPLASSSPSTAGDPIATYAQVQRPGLGTICARLRELIEEMIPKASSRVWHGSPVWFIDDNPVVGYSAAKECVHLLFWNGQAFDEAALKPVGKYGAAQASFAAADDIDLQAARRWLRKARTDVFDSKAFFKKMREEKKARQSVDRGKRTD